MRFFLKIICVVFVIFFSITIVCAAEKRETKRVLVLAGHFKNQPAIKLVEKGIQQVFQANTDYRIKVDIEYLDLYRFTSKHYKQEMIDLLRHKYGDRQIDVVITILTSALRFMLDDGDEIFPGIPTVFTVVTESNLTGLNLPGNVTGISYKIDISGTIEAALKLQPDTKHVVLIGGISKTIRAMCGEAEKIFQAYEDRLQFTYLTDHTMAQILEKVAHLPKDTIIFNMGVYRDKAGNVFVPSEAMEDIAEKSNAPSYTFHETVLGSGFVGGRLVGFEIQGRKAAAYALAILKGEKPSDLPVTSYGTIVPMFDWRQLQRWGLDEQRLPEGSIVRYKELTTWELYKWYIIGGICLFIIEAILILLLLFNWARRVKAESALRKSHKELELRVEERTAELSKTNEQLKEEFEERKQAEETLWDVKRRNQALLDHSPVCHKIVDLNFNLAYMSANGFKMLQLDDNADLYGQPYPFEFFPAAFRNKMTENLKKAKETGDTITMEALANDIEGNEVWLDSTLLPVLDDAGKIDYITVVSANTTQRKRAGEEKTKLQSQLQQSQKMESIGTLAGGIAHDFNNILGIILGNAELAMDDVAEWNPARQNLDEVKKACMRAKDVVRQILSFSRKSEIEQKSINITSVITESLKLSRASIPTSIEIRQNIANDVDDIFGDPTQIHQVMINLCTNAAYAMENDGGILEVTLENTEVDEDTASQYPELNPGPHVHLRVRDTGDGINPEIVGRVFDPYFTTKEVGKGTGMGLAVVHGIVKSHHGSISVESKLGKGAKFKLLFPSVIKKSKGETKKFQELPTGKERILFVDDEESMVDLNQQRLERLGYNVIPKTDPSEALEFFRTNPDQIDLIISDMTMPHITGDKLAQEILNIRPDMPIILCTGYSERMSEDRAQEIGIRKYIEKPIEKETLARSIREVLDAG
jgi:two-component system, cell cycle sensor histidine kinase and response regulator CckA